MIRQVPHAVEVKERYGRVPSTVVGSLKRIGLRWRLFRLPFARSSSKFRGVSLRYYRQATEITMVPFCRELRAVFRHRQAAVETSSA